MGVCWTVSDWEDWGDGMVLQGLIGVALDLEFVLVAGAFPSVSCPTDSTATLVTVNCTTHSKPLEYPIAYGWT